MEHCPSTKFVLKAYHPNLRVEFRFYSERRKGGISSIIPPTGHLKRGVIYEMSEEDMAEFDVLESVPPGLFSREMFLVLGEDHEWHEAELYRVVNPQGPFPPATSYITPMLEGAKAHDLDREYVEDLRALLEPWTRPSQPCTRSRPRQWSS